MPPSHQTEAIVARYAPLIETAVRNYPEVSIFTPANDLAESTFVARFRDSMRALILYEYPNIDFPLDLFPKLTQLVENKEIKTSYKEGKLYVGSLEAIKATQIAPQAGTLLNIEATVAQGIVSPSEEILRAVAFLIQQRVLVSFTFTGMTLQQVDDLDLGVEAIETDKKITIYE